jgi:elongation factor G
MILLWLRIEPKSKADQEKLGRGLQMMMAGEPSTAVRTAPDGTVMLGATSEAHLEALVDRLAREFCVEAAVSRPEIAYKEALTVSAAGDAKWAKRSGGRGQYAHVTIRVEPGQQGSGFVFENAIFSGAIPEEFVPAIREGIAETLDRGVLAGYPIDDVHVTLYDGSYHEVDSSAAAFKIAGGLAFVQAAKKGHPVLLEPFMHVSITVPRGLKSRVNDALEARRGEQFLLNDGRSESGDPGLARRVTITAELPLSQLFGFDFELRRRTEGLATCSMQFSHYGPATTAGDDGDRAATVMEPRRPRTPLRTRSAAVPEPEDNALDDDAPFAPRGSFRPW